MDKLKIPIVVFSLRIDSVTGLYEGDDFTIETENEFNIPILSSPKLTDHQYFVCVGVKAVKEGYIRMYKWLQNNNRPK